MSVPLTWQFVEFLTQTSPTLLDASSLENVNAKTVSCGARHTAIITGIMSELIKLESIVFCVCLQH